jgi:hypothetical protein
MNNAIDVVAATALCIGRPQRRTGQWACSSGPGSRRNNSKRRKRHTLSWSRSKQRRVMLLNPRHTTTQLISSKLASSSVGQ